VLHSDFICVKLLEKKLYMCQTDKMYIFFIPYEKQNKSCTSHLDYSMCQASEKVKFSFSPRRNSEAKSFHDNQFQFAYGQFYAINQNFKKKSINHKS
jgi:hypothetical protein